MVEKKNDFGQTLNLPRTSFPMRANLPVNEPKLLKKWEDMDLYNKIEEKSRGRPLYVLHDGPPYANGHIHAGTALNKVLKDIVVKYKTMSGFYAPYLPGWDCHGLPIELKVSQEIEKKEGGLTTVEIREACRKFAMKYVEIQRDEFRRLAVFGRWNTPYLTMNPKYEETVIEVFRDLFNKGYIYRQFRPVYWCYSCETALAEAEVEYSDKEAYSIFVTFKVVRGLEDIRERYKLPVYFVIWTTTPWTLPANVAIALNPGFKYVALKTERGIYILSMNMIEDPIPKMNLGEYEEVATFSGKELEGVVTEHPFIERESIVVLADYVSSEAGTGCVHTAPGHGHDDFITGKKYELPILTPVDDKGRFTEEVELFEGRFVFDADKDIIDLLKERGALLGAERISHSYPHCWRCKKPIIFRATEQWFVAVDNNRLRERALKAVKETEWIPKWSQARIVGMLNVRPDWCISRQRNWGVPIPIFYCDECNEPIVSDETLKFFQNLVREKGVEVWYLEETDSLLPPGTKCPKCGSKRFSKGNDILDVWFESGSSHLAVLKPENGLQWPSDLYLEGSDQHRGWFQISLLIAMATRGAPPFSTVLTHGFMIDENGRAMHKSLGNVISPNEITDKYGADVLRLWVTSEDYRNDIVLSFNLLDQVAEVYRRIRNTIRFMLGNLYDFDATKHSVSLEDMEEMDIYALMKFNELKKKVLSYYELMEFHKIFHSVHYFCAEDMSAFYLDVLKDRLYIEKPDSPRRRSAQTAISKILKEFLLLMAPIIPFTTEEAYQNLPDTMRDVESVHLGDLPTIDEWERPELYSRWEKLMEVRGEVNKALEDLRKSGDIGHSLDAEVVLYSEGEVRELLNRAKQILPELFIVSSVVFSEERLEGEGVSVVFDGDLMIKVRKAEGEKCPRCWHYSKEIGMVRDVKGLCPRCGIIISDK
ncbi:MAG: isoleucine--tRNA ligase [Candidatus Coatesbacteria bacterium]|nr:MAG: isoleucine--tRNA ligase [Candidatus Coatesbacteria bacterium]